MPSGPVSGVAECRLCTISHTDTRLDTSAALARNRLSNQHLRAPTFSKLAHLTASIAKPHEAALTNRSDTDSGERVAECQEIEKLESQLDFCEDVVAGALANCLLTHPQCVLNQCFLGSAGEDARKQRCRSADVAPAAATGGGGTAED